MTTSLKAAIAVLVTLILALFWVKSRTQAAEQCEIAYNELERLLQGGEITHGNPEQDHLFRVLLQYDQHWDYLEKLAADYDTVAFRPDRSQVYFLHERRYVDQAPEKPRLCVVTIESGGWENHTSHAGYPQYLQLDTLRLDQGTLQIYGSIREELDREPDLNGTIVRPGQKVRFAVDIENFRNKTLSLKVLGTPLAP
jgi:hypothetical protein